MKYLSIVLLLLLSQLGLSQSSERQVKDKINTLNKVIVKAKNSGIDAYKEEMTVRTAEVFLDFAKWDEHNISENTSYFEKVRIYADSAEQMAINLPEFERQEIIIMLDDAIDYLTKLKIVEVYRKPIPQIDWAEITQDKNVLLHNKQPVFLADYTWKPRIPLLQEYHGQQDGFYISPVHLEDANGTIKPSILKDLINKPTGTAGFIFLNNKSVPNWTKDVYGNNFKMREKTYTAYDIDNPGAKEMISALLAGTVPHMAAKNYSQLGYMLCNEPHFFTKKGVWATGSVSQYTIDKFKVWLENKHTTISNLNTLWNKSYTSFDEVNITIPINGALQGTPLWYDWARFNMYRVTEWYRFVKKEVQKWDPEGKVHLKIMPTLWNKNWRDHGIDLETLTHMSDIIGNDAGAWNNHMYGPTEWWEEDYVFEWREMSMSYDFLKSVSPDKIMYNNEAHYLSKGKSRNLYEDPPYTRATYWLAHTFGLNASQTWFWARRENGSIRPNAGKGYAGSNNQQPRIVNELHSTMMDLNSYSEEITAMQQQSKPLRIFYSKTSAINKTDHMDDVFELYKSLFFEGISLGFATSDIIRNHNHDSWKAIVIRDTEFVTQEELDALQYYLDQGGTIIKDEVSLSKNEYGEAHAQLIKSNGTLTILNNIDEFKAAGLSMLSEENLMPEVMITEIKNDGPKKCHWKCIKRKDGSNVVSIVNLGKSEATISLKLMNATYGTTVKSILNGLRLSTTQTLKPFEVLFAEITDGTINGNLENRNK